MVLTGTPLQQLMETASKGQANLVEEILKKKRRGKPLVTAVELDPQGYTAFGRVARETPASLVKSTLEILKEFGGDINQRCHSGFIPIQEAVLNRSDPAAVVSALISCGADTKILAKQDNTLLHLLLSREAACWDPRPTARLLIAAGIHPKTANADGQKPCDIDGKWCDTEDIREEIYIILGERPTADVVKDYNKIA
jgi:ankyrin repeat protein